MINTASITITSDLLVLIAEVDEFKGAWRAGHTGARTLVGIAARRDDRKNWLIHPD